MWAHVGKKMLFMGGEFGQRREWQHDESLEWHVLQYPLHAGVQQLGARSESRSTGQTPALYQQGLHAAKASSGSTATTPKRARFRFLRKGNSPEDVVLVVCNFTPVPRDNYRVGVPRGGQWRERLNSDAHDYGGSGVGNFGIVEAAPLPSHGRHHSLTLRLPPLAMLFLTPG